MVTAAELRTNAVTINALMEGFERTYLEYLEEVGTKEDSERTKKRYRAVCAFYHIRDLLDKFADDLEQAACCAETRKIVFPPVCPFANPEGRVN